MSSSDAISHIAVGVTDMERALGFYTSVFGFDVIAREPRANAAFLRAPRSG